MELPAEKPRMMPGVMSPDNVLEAVMAGVDIFDSSYPFHLGSGITPKSIFLILTIEM